MERYSIIKEKRPREIVLLRGSGCVYKKCTFCDYHLDFCKNEKENFILNKSVLDRVTGIYGELEVINSGSVFELDNGTIAYLIEICKAKNIKIIHFEAHYLYNGLINSLRQTFSGFELKMKLGLESFNYNFRENVLHKGIAETDPKKIAQNFNEANFLVGISGQTISMIEDDLRLGLEYFERICINVFCENSMPIKPDNQLIEQFIKEIYPKYKDNLRVDILISNLDFGVGD